MSKFSGLFVDGVATKVRPFAELTANIGGHARTSTIEALNNVRGRTAASGNFGSLTEPIM